MTPEIFARVAALSGDDALIYRLGGAAILGYPIALAVGLRTAEWRPLRLSVSATWVFAVFASFASLAEVASGRLGGVVVAILIWSALVAGTATQLLVARRGVRPGPRDVATWVVVVLVLATASAATFGLGPLATQPFAALMGYRGTDEYVYWLAGSACFGYAVLGVLEMRSLHWDNMRLPNVMALVFNGLAFAASLLEILAGRTTLLAALVVLAAGAFTFAIAAILVRRGR